MSFAFEILPPLDSKRQTFILSEFACTLRYVMLLCWLVLSGKPDGPAESCPRPKIGKLPLPSFQCNNSRPSQAYYYTALACFLPGGALRLRLPRVCQMSLGPNNARLLFGSCCQKCAAQHRLDMCPLSRKCVLLCGGWPVLPLTAN